MVEKTLAIRQQEPCKGEKPSQPVLALPYIRGLSERIRRIGSKYNIRTCFRSGNTIRSSLMKTRPPNADLVSVKRTDTKWETSVYRKPTHTGQYLNHESNHHQSTKRGIIKTLLDRAFGLCNMEEGLEKELDIIKNDLQRNGYSKAMVEKTLAIRQQEPRKEEKPSQPVLALPYIRGLSERIKRIGSKYNIRTCFRSGNTIRSSLTKTRPPNADCDSKNCIYLIPCECGKSYIGETKRPSNVRTAEHKKHTQRGETSKSGIADHVWTHQHNIEWSQAEISHREEHWFRIKFKEAAYMLSNNIFRQASVEILNICKPIIKRKMANSRQNGHLPRNQ
ncbi:uncharacterized protein [Leptinotarsa decemlineata]|uniref:uncharacterized protein n=1 Tax=Leptinotarsa decemlineata TaxID=7539 RepID=UPI003D309FC4